MIHSSTEDRRRLRNALGSFVTGVTVVTARDAQGDPVGITANSFTSVSLEPPLILVSLSRNLRSFSAFEVCDSFAINILRREQDLLGMRFARSGEDKWSGVQLETTGRSTPLINGRLAHFECEPWARYDGGDHLILVGRVLCYEDDPEGTPLVYFRGAFNALSQPFLPNPKGVTHA